MNKYDIDTSFFAVVVKNFDAIVLASFDQCCKSFGVWRSQCRAVGSSVVLDLRRRLQILAKSLLFDPMNASV